MVLLVEYPERIGVAEVDELAVFLAALQHEQCVVFPHRGVVAIAGFGDDVVIAAQHHGPVRRQQPARMGDQAVAPVELVRIFFGIDRIAVRQIDRRDAEAVDGRLDIPRLFISRVAGQAGHDIGDGEFRQDGDAVP